MSLDCSRVLAQWSGSRWSDNSDADQVRLALVEIVQQERCVFGFVLWQIEKFLQVDAVVDSECQFIGETARLSPRYSDVVAVTFRFDALNFWQRRAVAFQNQRLRPTGVVFDVGRNSRYVLSTVDKVRDFHSRLICLGGFNLRVRMRKHKLHNVSVGFLNLVPRQRHGVLIHVDERQAHDLIDIRSFVESQLNQLRRRRLLLAVPRLHPNLIRDISLKVCFDDERKFRGTDAINLRVRVALKLRAMINRVAFEVTVGLERR